MNIIYNKDTRAAYAFDTPIEPPPTEVERQRLSPGTCVMERKYESEWTRKCGRVSVKDDFKDVAVVIGHGCDESEMEQFTWEGTIKEFDESWDID
jgi:hypothetical protein